jgi:hypothetical protein
MSNIWAAGASILLETWTEVRWSNIACVLLILEKIFSRGRCN